jgi:uncharacterized protein YybS (DUF2232 family)
MIVVRLLTSCEEVRDSEFAFLEASFCRAIPLYGSLIIAYGVCYSMITNQWGHGWQWRSICPWKIEIIIKYYKISNDKMIVFIVIIFITDMNY